MGWVWWFLAVPLGAIAAWAILAPRSQWAALFSWSVSNRHSSEPGGAAYAYRQAIAAVAIGLAALTIVLAALSTAANAPQAADTTSDIELTWGSPQPLLVYRAFQPSTTTDELLVDVPISSYLPVNDEVRAPRYLVDLEPFSRLGTSSIPGYLGSSPGENDSPIGRADVVVHLRGPLLCIPRRVVAIEGPELVQLAVLYGLPTPSDGSEPDHIAGCPLGEDLTGSVLIPISLNDPIGTRAVESLDGTRLTLVETPD